MEPRTKHRRLRVALAVLLSCSFLLVDAAAAQAVSVNLAGTAYRSKTYYSTPRYKPTTGGAGMTGTDWTPGPAGCGGGGLYTGFRSNPGYSGENTQFPWNRGSVTYINVTVTPNSYSFPAMTYYMTAQYIDQPSCWAEWHGTLNW